jgi:TPR repeat protein
MAAVCAAGLSPPVLALSASTPSTVPAQPMHGTPPGLAALDRQRTWSEVQAAHARKDWATVLRLYRQLADAGDRVAQFNLGQMHRLGDGVPPNPAEAFRWYLKAAEAGHPGAQNNLGMSYLEGVGTAKDPEKARHWLEKAAAQGFQKAKETLARLPPATAPSPPERAVATADRTSSQPQRGRAEAEDAARRAEAEAQRLGTEEKAADDAMEALNERASKLMEAFGQGRQVSMSDVERTQRELAQLEQRRQRASDAAEAARQRARELRSRADQMESAQQVPVRQERVAASPARSGQAEAPARSIPPASGGAAPAGEGQLYYVAAGVYDKTEMICSDTRLVINGPMRSAKKPGVLASEIRTKLRKEYPHSSHSSYLVEVASPGQAMIVYQVKKTLAGYRCKDNHIQVALGRTMAEAESKMAKLPRSWQFVREIQRWPQGLDR